MKSLSFDQTRGTKTYHLPLKRGPETHPHITLVVGKGDTEGTFRVGMSICGPSDNFCKSFGRRRAFHRLHGRYLEGRQDTLAQKIFDHVSKVRNRHNATWNAGQVTSDIYEIVHKLEETFASLDKNREAKEATT